MSARHKSAILVSRDEIVAPPAARCCEDRTFELPTAIYLGMALMFFGFVSVLSMAFRSPGMAVPFAIFVVFIVAFFTVPGFWVRMKSEENCSEALTWAELGGRGIRTPQGVVSGREATVLALLLPFVILCWAVAVAIIAALS